MNFVDETRWAAARQRRSGGSTTWLRMALLSATTLGLMLAAGALRPQVLMAQEGPVQVIELTAKKYEYSPAPVHVRAGTKVQLRITAVDHDHGFKLTTVAKGGDSAKPGIVLSSPQDCWQIKKGETITVEFVAQTRGTYPFKCCHVCGLGHGGMKSEIVVE